MVSPFLTLLAGVLVLLCFWLYRCYTFWKRNGIPSSKGVVPFFGHMFPVFIGRINFFELLDKMYEEHEGSSMFGLYKAFQPSLVIREPALVKRVLQNNFTSFHENSAKIDGSVDPLMEDNPFFNSGEAWVVGRKRITYAFSSMRLKILYAAVDGVCKKFVDFLDRRLKSADKYEVELKYLFSKFTGEVVANAGLGIEGFCFDDKDHEDAFDSMGHAIFKQSFIQSIGIFIMLFVPQMTHIFNSRLVPEKVDKQFRRLVSENLKLRQTDSTPRNDFLQLMISFEKSEQQLNEKIIASYAFSFFADGFHTSSITLTFAGYHLAVHQDVQEKLRKEVNEIIAKHGGALTYESLKEMTYMDQVISESQRLLPALGAISKLCTEEIELHGSDGISCRLKPGDEVLIPLSGLQRDPKYWDDTDNFDPERFNDERKQSIEKMTFIPFGEGPRMCVGMRMALLQMKSCLATLLRGYKLELSPKTKLPLKLIPISILSEPIGGIWIRISKL